MVDVLSVDVPELARVVSVHNAVRPDDPTTPEELVDWKRQAQDTVWLVAVDESEDVGAGIGVLGWHSRPETALVELWALPESRGRGVGSALWQALVGWSAERECTAVETNVAEDDPESLAWAERRGLHEVGRNSQLVLELDAIEAPDVEPPSGIEIGTWAERPGIERDLYAVYVEAIPDVPGEEEAEISPFEEWLANDMQGLADLPEAVFVALADGEVVGYAKLALPHARTGSAFHDLTGVRRAWRGRGVAGALKRAQMAWAKERGYRRLVTRNEVRNEPIRRLNERHGYRVEPGTIRLRTKLPGVP